MRQEKEGGGDWQECSSGASLQVCTSSVHENNRMRLTGDLQILMFGFGADCIPAVCMLLIGGGSSVFAVMDVQSFCMVGSRGVLDRPRSLPLGAELVVWEIKVIALLEPMDNAEMKRGGWREEGSQQMRTERDYARALTIIQSEAVR